MGRQRRALAPGRQAQGMRSDDDDDDDGDGGGGGGDEGIRQAEGPAQRRGFSAFSRETPLGPKKPGRVAGRRVYSRRPDGSRNVNF